MRQSQSFAATSTFCSYTAWRILYRVMMKKTPKKKQKKKQKQKTKTNKQTNNKKQTKVWHFSYVKFLAPLQCLYY